LSIFAWRARCFARNASCRFSSCDVAVPLEAAAASVIASGNAAPNGFSKFHCERETLPSNVEGGLSLAGIRSSHRVHRACLGRRQAQGHHARECESSYTLLECVCACAASACVLMLAVLSASCSTFLLRCSALVRTHLTAGLGRGSFFSSLRACCAASSACAPCS
jgi:hypothetical protein